jgi:hypothetical protein
MPKSTRPSQRRHLDAESGMNRTSTHKSKRRRPLPLSSSSDEVLSSDTELESELEQPAKDDSRRKTKKVPAPAAKGRKDGRSRDIKGEEDNLSDLDKKKSSETGLKVAPHRQVLLAATYHVGISSISRPAMSSFIPSCYNFMSMVYNICSLLIDNTLVHEICPEFFTPAIYLYYSHVFYYHILRARAAAGSDVLTRFEKRVLTYYERVGPAESWPIAAPLLGFLEYFGSHKTEDPYYGWIVPKLPLFNTFGSANCLNGINAVAGISRVPLVPAYQKFLYNFGQSDTSYDDDVLYPIDQTNLDAHHTFCGITASTAATANFQTLAFNLGWVIPLETGQDIGVFDYDIKHSRIRRWNVPDVTDTTPVNNLASFLGFRDDASFDWMKHLLRQAEIVNRFFPGSGYLASVPPLTTLGMATYVNYSRSVPALAGDNKWYHGRKGLTFKFYGYSNTETGFLDTKMALTVSPRATFSASAIPAIAAQDRTEATGPFFVDDIERNINTESKALPLTEGANQIDPARRFLELVSRLYDNRAGRN